MKVYLLVCPLIALSFLASCKKESTTNAPVPRSKISKKSAMAAANASAEVSSEEKKPTVLDIKEVPLEEMPRVTVDIDLSRCMGIGRWIDPKTPATPRLGAVSLTLTTTTTSDWQPEAWVYEPVVNTASDGSIMAKGQHAWRLDKTKTYTLDAVAYNVQSSSPESKLSKKIDFNAQVDVSIKITGDWKTSVCEIQWQ